MWFTIVSVFYVLVCAFLILVVLLQQGKGGGMGSAFGGSTQTVFGGAGAGNFLTRLTAIAATLFMVLSAMLAYMSSSGDRALDAAERVEQERQEDSVSAADDGDDAEGETEDEAPPASADTPSQAEQDEALNALEEALGVGAPEGAEPAAEEPAAEEPAAEEPAAEEPAAEEPAAEEPAAEEAAEEPAAAVPAPAAAVPAERPARPARAARPAPAPAPAPAAAEPSEPAAAE